MVEKQNTSLKISEENIPKILHVRGKDEDPNLQDVPHRDIPKYLREQYWIGQWGPTSRWKFDFGAGTWRQLRPADLNRKLDDPGDAFFELGLGTLRSSVSLRIWVEVTEVFLPEHAPMVNRFVREHNSLRGKGKIDPTEFLNSLKLGLPTPYLQCEMADKVIEAIEKKANKGKEEGSYKSLVRDYGRGALIVGLPMWFATLPSDPTDLSTVLTDFVTRLAHGIKKIEKSILRASWCPFDSVVVLWNPTLESIDEWTQIANLNFYSDPVNLSWKSAGSPFRGFLFSKAPNLPTPSSVVFPFRWDRYRSLDAMLADQRQWLRLPSNPRPLGPKAYLKVDSSDTGISALRMDFNIWLLQLLQFVRINGWRGLRRWIASRFSVCRLYSRWLQGRQARKLYQSSSSNRSKSNVKG